MPSKKLEIIKRLFFEKTFFLWEVFAFVDSQLSLGFQTAAFACVLASKKGGKLEERAFGTERAQSGSPNESSFFGRQAVQ